MVNNSSASHPSHVSPPYGQVENVGLWSENDTGLWKFNLDDVLNCRDSNVLVFLFDCLAISVLTNNAIPGVKVLIFLSKVPYSAESAYKMGGPDDFKRSSNARDGWQHKFPFEPDCKRTLPAVHVSAAKDAKLWRQTLFAQEGQEGVFSDDLHRLAETKG